MGDDQPISLDLVAEGGMTSPVAMVPDPEESDRFFVVDQAGMIHIVEDGEVLDEPFLDLTDEIVEFREGFDERGLLGLALHPDYDENGLFYVYYSAPLRDEAPEDWDHTSHISEFEVSEDDPDQADPDSERILLQVDQPQFNHDGGTVAFGPEDGYLYISLGDGGGANDNQEGHVDDWYEDNEGGNGQDVEENLLGSILRIDVDEEENGEEYGIPDDNPFVDRPGMDEIYAYGLRNPYRMSFDMEGDNDLFALDAGQELWEEISIVEEGDNLGWNVKEGTHCFDAANPTEPPEDCPGTVGPDHPDEGAELIDPVIEFSNSKDGEGLGVTVSGGYVYRGDELSEMDGNLVFGTWSMDRGQPRGRLFAAEPSEDEDELWEIRELVPENQVDGTLGLYVLSIGQDNDGELYVLTNENTAPVGETGQIWRIVPRGEAMETPEPGDDEMVSPSPTPSPGLTPTPSPEMTPTPTPEVTPTPTPTVEETPEATPTP